MIKSCQVLQIRAKNTRGIAQLVWGVKNKVRTERARRNLRIELKERKERKKKDRGRKEKRGNIVVLPIESGKCDVFIGKIKRCWTNMLELTAGNRADLLIGRRKIFFFFFFYSCI